MPLPLDLDGDFLYDYYNILYFENLFPAGGGRRVVFTMCTKWYLPTVRMLLGQVLQSWSRFSPRFSELVQRCNLWGRRFIDLSICRFVVLSFCRFDVLSFCHFVVCRVDKCCFSRCLLLYVGSLLLRTAYHSYMYNCRVGSSFIQIHSPASLFGSTCTFQVSCTCARDRGGMAHFKR